MLKFKLCLMFLCFYVFNVFANIETSIGYKASKIDDMNKTSSGLSLTIGKVYNFNEMFGATTSLDFSFTGYKQTLAYQGQELATYRFKRYQYGVLQRFFYKAPIKSFQLKPFLELGLGLDHAVVEFESMIGVKENDSKNLFYYKYGLGFQILFTSGVGGEFVFGKNKNKDFDSNYTALSFIYTF